MSYWFVFTGSHMYPSGSLNQTDNDAVGVTSPPVIYSGSVFGTKSNPANGVHLYRYAYSQSSIGSSGSFTHRWAETVGNATVLLYYSSRSYSGSSNSYSFTRRFCGNLIRSNQQITNTRILAQGTNVTTTTVSGKFRPKSNSISSTIQYGGVDIPVVYSYSGITYDHMIFPSWTTNYQGFTYSSTASSGSGAMSVAYNRAGFAGYKESEFEASDDILTWFTTAYNTNSIADDFIGKIIDFGDIPQEVPTFFVTWLNANYDQVYTNTYTIKNQGGETLAQITEAPAVKAAELLYVGTTATLNLTGVNDLVYTASWSVVTPTGKQFTGLKATNGVVIPLGTSTVSFIGATFTETFETYKPPATTFNVNVYENTAEPNRVDKTSYLSAVTTLSGALREQTSIINPSIVIQRTTLPRFNYVYIPEFHRYYFVVNITAVRMKLWQIDLKCDPLMTYKTGIGTLNAVIGRQENISNPDLTDTELPLEKENAITVQEITSNAFSTSSTGQVYNYVLTVVGA